VYVICRKYLNKFSRDHGRITQAIGIFRDIFVKILSADCLNRVDEGEKCMYIENENFNRWVEKDRKFSA